MADAAVGFVVEKLRDVIVQEAINLYGVRDEVEWLERELRRMQCFLKDADAKKNNGGIDGERVKNWVTEMRDLAFEAEDIIDTFMYYKLRRRESDGCIGFIERFTFIFDELVSRHKVHVQIERVKTKLLELSRSREVYGISNIGETIVTTSHPRSQNVIPILPQLRDDIDMVGFDDEKKKIVLELVDINNTNQSVISIVGMGGLGKTTLAKSVYNDLEVKRSFDIFVWVIISQQYTILEILKEILSETSPEDTIQTLSVKVFEKLKKGKYLVVLDDVWKADVWNELLKVFPDINNGSRVIITTRFANVAKIANPTTKPHELRCLDENESRELFLRKVFPNQNIETCCPTYLVDYAHQLVQRCGGLPLALVVLGGLVSTKPQTKDAWRKVVENMKGQFVEGGERCLEIIALSYNDLPYYLKSCFLYFGCFKEDMTISAETLIRLWLAEGFLPAKNIKTTEEIGLDCLEELAQRSLIQVTDRKYDDSANEFRIHDLLRDVCIREAKENRYFEVYNNNDNVDSMTMSNAARRLVVCNKIDILNYSNLMSRGLFYGVVGIINHLAFSALKGQLDRFKLLRVLCLYTSGISEFPSEIKSLIHLRYLELHILRLKEVPSWIGHLRNLQTFIVFPTVVYNISDSLWTIDNLRHVDLPCTKWVPPPNMGNNVPKNLQTLKGVNAGSWIKNTLPKLTNLCKLKIHRVCYYHADALSSSLQKLGRLVSFTIHYGQKIPLDNIITAFSNQHCLKDLYLDGSLSCEQLPHNDVFPQQLMKLDLLDSGLEQDPMATLEKLPYLKYLRLHRAYRGKQMICSATGFPQLLSLIIENLEELEEWQIQGKAMSCLKSLKIQECKRLKMIPEGLRNVLLDQLKLDYMFREFVSRTKENTGEDWYKIQHVPNISFI
ncbi:disease resistance protein RPH8A-like [Dioscorea cayenensis subsp. rotundata]|uniref:Disease resistance protein RPH8A-like n=1 Tax=Dioscorea cayennensis subsp. rotundata TaxID=55577 RepID=A0AB40D4Q3_DIOCR|nr:disease resistance protein RPH8A-like [Dioscorea cayenensis subsp. rotundata]